MHEEQQFLEFVRLPMFEKQAKGLLSEEEVRAVEQDLMENPTAGPVIAGTGGLRKLRFAVGGRGSVEASGSSTITEANGAASI